MDDVASPPDAVEPTDWFVVFHEKSPNRWISALAAGRFKHVSALAYCPGFRAWLVYDTQFNGTRLFLIPHGDAIKAFYGEHTRNAAVVKFVRRHGNMGLSSRLGFYCVPAIKHVLGVRCRAMRPDALYRHLLRNGGQLIDERARADTGT